MWDSMPQSTVVTGSLNQRGDLFVPWAAGQMPIPQSDLGSLSSPVAHYQAKLVADQASAKEGPTVFDSIVSMAKKEGAPPGFSVAFPEAKTGVYTVSAFPSDPTQEVTMHFDQYSGKLLASVGWKDYGLVPKAVEMGISIHMGKYFGLANQMLMLLAALITILLSITGTVMWWQRRPKGSVLMGAPTMPPYVQHWKMPLAIVAVLGFVFPLVGLSLVVVLLLDYLLLSRIPFNRHDG